MGMSATQARYLSLVAQQSNLEYQGQQINQERSVLSQQVSELYNSLLNMQVPTPPSTTDYTKVQYEGSLGATKFSIPANNIKPGKDGKYCVTIEEKAYGDSLSMNKGYSIVSDGSTKLKGEIVAASEINKGTVTSNTLYVYDENGTLRSLTDEDYVTDPESGNKTIKEGLTIFVPSEEGSITASIAGTATGTKVAGADCYTLQSALSSGAITEEVYSGFVNAIKNTFPQDGENAYKPEDFYIFKDSSNTWHFALIKDVGNGDESTLTYDYIPNGEFTEETTYNPCGLTFDAGSGRITAVQIPVYNEAKTEIISYSEVKLEAVSVTDELAYNEAVNKYEYEQYEYDKKQQEINAKTEVIQQQDRNLELKLQRLDTQRQQITTEIEALEKVLQDNIEASYKTFSG